jgi:geranylgeranyl pyrophosphate synthase
MDFLKRSEKAQYLAYRYTKERLKNHNYSKDVLQAFTLLQTPPSETINPPKELIFMDIAWQISGEYPPETDLAKAYFPIMCFFFGTMYQDDLLDSLSMENPRVLVKSLGIPTCLIMGNILYCEALLSFLDQFRGENKSKILQILQSLEKMVKNVMNTEINRRKYIGKIMPLEVFFDIWRLLTPNVACIEVGGIFGQSNKKEIQILAEIGSNLSIVNRINKEIHEMYGLRGSLVEKLRRKPPPLPVTLGYKSASSSEKKAIGNTIKRISLMDSEEIGPKKEIEIIEPLTDVIIKYNALYNAFNIHNKIINEIKELIAQLSNLEHRKFLSQLLGLKFLTQDVSNNLKSNFNVDP